MSALTKKEAATIQKPRKNDEYTFWGKLRRNSSSYVLMAPYMILFAVFTIIPVISAIFLSFTNFNLLQAPTWVGIDNYMRMFLDDPIFLLVLKNTLIFAIITGPISYLIQFIAAWLINELGPKMRSVMTLIFYAPSMVGAMGVMWGLLFSSDTTGYINSILMSMGILSGPVYWLSDPNTIMTVVMIIAIWQSLGAGFLSFIAGFQGLDKSYFEAAAIDGVRNRWQELWYVTIPQMAPQMLFAAVLAISGSFGSTLASSLAGQPTTQYSADTIVTYLTDVGNVRFEMGYASAIAVFLFVMM
ncbi:MAG: sugar ABC transporter permease, partial [Oscillospiraceae bacterium]